VDGVACDDEDAPVEPVADVSPELPWAVIEPELWFGLEAAVPAVDCPPDIDPLCVVPVDCVLAWPRVSLFEPEQAAIKAAAASAVPK
jgi:hypothetical protein